MSIVRNKLRFCNVMSLAEVPEHIPDDKIRLVEMCSTYVDVSKTCQETWQVGVILSDDDDNRLRGVGRVLVNVSHGYGG